MYRLREMDVDDKVCEQVSMTMLEEVYPQAIIERCVRQSQPWSTKARRVRASTGLALVLFVIGMALWSRLNQCQVWQKLVGKLSALHPAEPTSTMSDSGVSAVTFTQICRGETYQTQALHTLITQMVTAQANKRLGTGYQLSGAVESRVTASHLLHGEQQRAGMTIEVRGSGTWSYQFDEAYLHTIATRLAGQNRQQATELLLHLPGVSQVAMTISGTETTSLPPDPARIHLVVLAHVGP